MQLRSCSNCLLCVCAALTFSKVLFWHICGVDLLCICLCLYNMCLCLCNNVVLLGVIILTGFATTYKWTKPKKR